MNRDAVQKAFASVRAEVDAGHLPGVAVIVIHQGETLLESQYGWAMLTPDRIPLPPTPIFDLASVTKVAATGIEKRRPVGIAKRFPIGTPKIHVHFCVAAPERFKQKIRFQWYVNGQKRGRPIPSSIIGGRKQGFRTWTYRSSPHQGAYRVDLETQEGQLIARVSFKVVNIK